MINKIFQFIVDELNFKVTVFDPGSYAPTQWEVLIDTFQRWFYILLIYYLGLILPIYILSLPLIITGRWRIFIRAGENGWKAVIPIYNKYILCKMLSYPKWFFILYYIPIINFAIHIIVSIRLAKAFNRGKLFALGLITLNPIFILILGFGKIRFDLKK